MNDYQKHLFAQLGIALAPFPTVSPVVRYDYANVGDIMLMDGLTLIESWHFDVQGYRVSIIRRDKKQGPRQDGVFWWKPNDPSDNEEVHRFMEAWVDTASAHVRSKTL